MTDPLKRITETLEEIKKTQQEMQETQSSHTGSFMRIESTLEGYADSYKVNKTNIERLDDRLVNAEDKLGIQITPEQTIQR